LTSTGNESETGNETESETGSATGSESLTLRQIENASDNGLGLPDDFSSIV
jgi:hypothetical protein